MFNSSPSILLYLIICLHFAIKVDLVSVDSVIQQCQAEVQKFSEKEDKFVEKGRLPNEPTVFEEPFIEEQDIYGYQYELSQRTFECIADTLHEYSDSNLQSNASYRSLVQECKAIQPITPQCDNSYPYRNINGTCNNLDHPRWGSTFSCFRRLFPPNYEGVSGLRKSVKDKKPLPNARTISRLLVLNIMKKTSNFNTLFAYFGQPIAHDAAMFPISLVHGKKRIGCCKLSDDDDHNHHPQCAEIDISVLDLFYSLQNVHCFNVARVVPCDTCSVGKRIPINYLTAWLDLSIVYGQTDERAQKLRRNDGTGKLMSQDRSAGELLPPDESRGSKCGFAPTKKYCFETGDTRTNQHTALMTFQTIFLREHNRIAGILKDLNPQWDEERLYQESKKILIAEWQVIIYKEYLPILLGPKIMSEYELNMGSGNGYDPSIDPSISVEFNAAAFRIHSILPGKVVSGFDIQLLQHLYYNSLPIYYDRMSGYLHKMSTLPGEKYDRFMTTDVTIWTNRELLGTWGFDLVALDIQRGRDVGLPSYAEVIENMEHRPGTIKAFEDLSPYIVPSCISLLKFIYDDVRDVDFYVGINCEKVPDDMEISPTAAKIVAEQFRALKYGDRFHVEHDATFTDGQRKTLMDASVTKLICDNTKVGEFPTNALLLPSDKNSVQSCSEFIGVDLKKWKE